MNWHFIKTPTNTRADRKELSGLINTLRKRQDANRELLRQAENVAKVADILHASDLGRLTGKKLSQELTRLGDQAESLKKKTEKSTKLQERDLQRAEALSDKLIATSSRLEFILMLSTFVLLFGIATFFGLRDPKIGPKIDIEYYTTVASIIPILFIAAYIETGQFKQSYRHKLQRLSSIIGASIPLYLGEFFCLIVIASKHSTTFFFFTTMMMVSTALINLITAVYFGDVRQNIQSASRALDES